MMGNVVVVDVDDERVVRDFGDFIPSPDGDACGDGITTCLDVRDVAGLDGERGDGSIVVNGYNSIHFSSNLNISPNNKYMDMNRYTC